jgi:type II restriction enzyme
MAQTRGNIGEWSELYALAYLLLHGGANAADEKQKPIPDLYFKVLQIIIASRDMQDEMRYDINEHKIGIFENGDVLDELDKSILKNQVDIFFRDLTSGAGRKTFSMPSGDKLMKLLHKKTISAGSGEREADLQLVIADEESGGPTPRYGFSIKSQLGQASTLLNSSGSTNIVYEIKEDPSKKQNGIPDLSATPSSHPQNVRAIYDAGYFLDFFEYQSDTFSENLGYVDSNLPEHLAKVLLTSYLQDDIKSFAKISELVFPISDRESNQPLFKLREFLGAVSMGLRPSKEWRGNPSKFKGLMVVKDDGDVIFYYMNSRLNFEEYLFQNVRFDRPSTRRHRYGQVFEDEGRFFIKLNLQIRFRK